MSKMNYTALQGKVCVVTLRGTAGSNYRWCLTSMPKELALFGTDQEVDRPSMVGCTQQEHFYFLVKGSEDINVELNFELICVSDPAEVSKTCNVKIRIIPANSNDFASLDTVAQVENVDAGALLKYGYVCGVQNDQALKYGFVCDMQNSQQLVKYGYPCGVQDSQQLVKYGYPCSVQDSQQLVKYGYPCGVQDSQQLVKYGYPCGVQDSQQLVKYGYPCSVQDSQQLVKYGYPCGVQDSQQLVKYGYPCSVQDN